MKKFMLFTVSALVLAALAFSAFTPSSLAAGRVISAARAAFAGKSPTANDTPQAQSSTSEIESEKHNGQDDAQPTLEATPDDDDMDATETPEAENHDADDDAGEMEFSGALETMNSGSWMVGGKTVLVNAQTEIEGTFVIGDQVKVHAFVNADGTLTAREIQNAVATSDDNSGNSSTDDDSANKGSNSGSGSLEDNSGKHGGADDGSGHR